MVEAVASALPIANNGTASNGTISEDFKILPSFSGATERFDDDRIG